MFYYLGQVYDLPPLEKQNNNNKKNNNKKAEESGTKSRNMKLKYGLSTYYVAIKENETVYSWVIGPTLRVKSSWKSSMYGRNGILR